VSVALDIRSLMTRFSIHEQISRLVCVEGLKNVKAITKLTYVAKEPRDYWAERGYYRYDGI
jgi:DMSO/TMAO reductase YedYZ molybdopterin-dependent catalytic subunit